MIFGIVLKLIIKVRLHVWRGSGAHQIGSVTLWQGVFGFFLWLSDSTTLSLFYKSLGDAVAC